MEKYIIVGLGVGANFYKTIEVGWGSWYANSENVISYYRKPKLFETQLKANEFIKNYRSDLHLLYIVVNEKQFYKWNDVFSCL